MTLINSAKLDKVTILLSTYNGSKFLQQQLDTLYQQTYPNVRILVRDDSSSDSTKNILGVEQLKGRVDVLEAHNNLGPALSFFELLRQAALTNTAYVAFCDQDDVWLDNKIQRAVDALMQIDEKQPAMYCSSVQYVDALNQFIKNSPIPTKIQFGNALVENIAPGCTIVLNKSARDVILSGLPNFCIMHDSWCYLVVSCFGKVIFDQVPSIRYRQHASNTQGAATSKRTLLFRRFKRFKSQNMTKFNDQAINFLALFEKKIPKSNIDLLHYFINSKKSLSCRVLLLINTGITRQTFLDNVLLRILIVLKMY